MRARILPIAACLLLPLACGSSDQKPQDAPATDKAPDKEADAAPKQDAGPPAGSLVVLQEGAAAYAKAEFDKPVFEVSGRSPSSFGRVAQVVGSSGEFIEVRTLAADHAAAACASGFGFEDQIEISFFVEPSKLRQVLAKPKTVENPDGSKLELAAGVPVVSVGDVGKVQIGDKELTVALSEDDVALWYQPGASAAAVSEDATAAKFVAAPFRYGSHELEQLPLPLPTATATREVEGGTLVSFSNACGTLTLLTSKTAADLEKFDPDMAEHNVKILSAMKEAEGACMEAPYTVPADTPLTWKNGTPAGKALTLARLGEAGDVEGDKMCFADAKPPVCVDATKAEMKFDPKCFGLVGAGEGLADLSGGGGRGFGGRGKPVPQVKQAKATVKGGLDEDIVRRIVRAHLNEIRTCYSSALSRTPGVIGGVIISFEVGADGKVSKAEPLSSSLEPSDDKLGECMAKAAKGWTFPKPTGGGTVQVAYPFIFAPG